jgi:hypothetical protein
MKWLVFGVLVACQPTASPPPPKRVVPIDAAIDAAIDAVVAVAPVDAPIDAEEVDDPYEMDPIAGAVRKAFHRNLPELPMISPDGKHIAIDRGYTHGMGFWETFKYAWYGPDGKVADKVDVVDEKTADGKTPFVPAKIEGASSHCRSSSSPGSRCRRSRR